MDGSQVRDRGASPGGKLQRWLKRAQAARAVEGASGSVAPPQRDRRDAQPANLVEPAPSSKLNKWLQRIQKGKESTSVSEAQKSKADLCSPVASHEQAKVAFENGDGKKLLSETINLPIDQPVDNTSSSGWRKLVFESGEYEGEFVDDHAHGFGRILWKSGVAYHGSFSQQKFHGKGCFFFENGDRFEGNFVDHKPAGRGILYRAEGKKRFLVEYDGTTKMSDGADPKVIEESPAEKITEEYRATIIAIAKGIKSEPFGLGDYRHCKAVDAKLAMAIPFRANRPLKYPQHLDGKIALVQRGGCSFAKKVRYCQAAGAVAVLVVGVDDDDKYRTVYQVHEGDPAEDNDTFEPGEDCSPVKVRIPTAYCLGIHERQLRDGAFVRMRFFPGAPGTPPGWLLGCVFIHPQSILPDLTPEEGDRLLRDFLKVRKEERRIETEALQRELHERQRAKDAAAGGGGGGGADMVESLLSAAIDRAVGAASPAPATEAPAGHRSPKTGDTGGGGGGGGGAHRRPEAERRELLRQAKRNPGVHAAAVAALRAVHESPAADDAVAALRAAAQLLLDRAAEIDGRRHTLHSPGAGASGSPGAGGGPAGGALNDLIRGHLGSMTFAAAPQLLALTAGGSGGGGGGGGGCGEGHAGGGGGDDDGKRTNWLDTAPAAPAAGAGAGGRAESSPTQGCAVAVERRGAEAAADGGRGDGGRRLVEQKGVGERGRGRGAAGGAAGPKHSFESDLGTALIKLFSS